MGKSIRNEVEKEVLKEIIDAGLTQKQIADHLGISPQAVHNRLKRGSVEPIRKAIDELSQET